MPWVSVGAAALGAANSAGLFGGGSKSAERAAKDAAARVEQAQSLNKKSTDNRLQPFIDAGTEASNKLSYLLGIGGYDVPKPTFEQTYDEVRSRHFNRTGKDYNRNSNVAGERVIAQRLYEQKLKDWQKGFDEWKANQGESSEFGSLLKKFDQSDLDSDLVYQNGLQFGLDEGRKAIESRARATGSNDSGSVLKALLKYGNDYATTKTEGAYNRNQLEKSQTYDFLSGNASRGLSATGIGAGVGTNSANATSNATQNLGNTLSTLRNNQASNQTDAINGLLSNLLYVYKNNQDGGSSRQYTPNPDPNNWGVTV